MRRHEDMTMRKADLQRGAAALLTLGVLSGPASARDAREHDGLWQVKTSAEKGACDTNYELNVAVTDGQVRYAGMLPVVARGTVRPGGLIAIHLGQGGDRVVATGLVRGDRASGEWTSSDLDCAGSWVASRKQ